MDEVALRVAEQHRVGLKSGIGKMRWRNEADGRLAPEMAGSVLFGEPLVFIRRDAPFAAQLLALARGPA
ncbi:hypothetical protein R69746_07715 [Paraburkholderia aspalathi]|nr:hypothetical protein R69746_07715 [Paraburkholderia aspalathi]CAE6866662.1 hypothetical protein R75465_08003 [Paraburkholderia aspalathi]